jgi:outer membrane protein TolC
MSGGPLQEVLRARAAATRLAEDASALTEERRAVLAWLNALLMLPSETPLDSAVVPLRIVRGAVSDSAREVRFVSAALGARASGSPLPSLGDLEELAARRSPLIRLHEAMIAAQAVRVELARRERRPDLDVAVQYGARPSHADMVTATVSVPLPRCRVQDQLTAAAAGERAALEAEHHQQLAEHRAEIARLRAEAERARTQLALLKAAALPQAYGVLAAGLASYESGQAALGAVLDARAQLFNQETAYFRALSDFAKALAELEMSVGGEVLP